MSRPSTYTKKLDDEICQRLGEGEPLRQICRDAKIPSWSSVYRWIEGNAEFAERIAHARARGFDAIAAECLQIADTPVEGIETTIKADGVKETRSGDMLGHRKLQIDTRLKLLAKWDPKRYGDSSKIELRGNLTLTDATDSELDDELAQLKALEQTRMAAVSAAVKPEPADE